MAGMSANDARKLAEAFLKCKDACMGDAKSCIECLAGAIGDDLRGKVCDLVSCCWNNGPPKGDCSLQALQKDVGRCQDCADRDYIKCLCTSKHLANWQRCYNKQLAKYCMCDLTVWQPPTW